MTKPLRNNMEPISSSELGIDLLSFAFDGPHDVDPGKPLYTDAEDPSRSLNKYRSRRLVQSLIAGFKAAGLRQGDVVLVNLANQIFSSAIYFAIIGAGCVYAAINPASRASELDHYLELTGPKLIITSQDVHSKVVTSAEKNGVPLEQIYVIDSKTFPIDVDLLPSPPRSPEDCSKADQRQPQNLTGLLRHGQSDWIRFSDAATAKNTPAAMFSTSGTSGLPKAAMLSHYALVCQHLSVIPDPPYEIRRLLTLPFFHLFAALFAHVPPVRNGQSLYVLPGFQLQQYVSGLEEFAITDTIMAPPIVHMLNKSSLPLERMLRTIRYVAVGGTPIDIPAMQRFQHKLHDSATLTQVWGMTEVGPALFHQYPHKGHLGSVGIPMPGYEMRLLDAFEATITADHEPGELQVRYVGLMTGYKNQGPIPEGSWYSSGDIMTRVSGRYYVVGRIKELIKVNGFQVPPAELEATLLTHPCIIDAAVIGCVRADGVTEVPRAFIIRKSDEGRCSRLTADEVYTFAAERLSSYKRLDGGIVFVDEIPRTASGKVQRFKLAQMDQFRNSITEILVPNDQAIEVQYVQDLQTQLTTTRRSQRFRQPPSEQVKSGTFAVAKPKRRSKSSLRMKMKALQESSLSTHGAFATAELANSSSGSVEQTVP